MKYLFVLAFALVAIKASYAEDHKVKDAIEQVQKAFHDMGKTINDNIDPEEIKETWTKKFEEMKTQMGHINEDVQKYMNEHPESGVGQAYAKMQELAKEFSAKNPDVEANLKNFQKIASETGEKFADSMKEVYSKMTAEGGLKDQVSQFFTEMTGKMGHTAADIEAKLKEMLEKAQH